MRTRHVAWVGGLALALALGAGACGGEDEGPTVADPAVVGVPADQVPSAVTSSGAEEEAPAAAAAPPATAQPPLPSATTGAQPSPGSLSSVNWFPNPPPCVDCPIAPPAATPAAPATPAPRPVP